MWLIAQEGGSSDPVFSDDPQTGQTMNRNDLSQYPSSLATEFLSDMIGRFGSLEWIPGGLYGADQREVRDCSLL